MGLTDDETGQRLLHGTKLSKIKARALLWNGKSDEIEELKKIFFEFLKKLCEAKTDNLLNKPKLIERLENEEVYSLDSILGRKNFNKQRRVQEFDEEEDYQLIDENTTFNKNIRLSYKKANYPRDSRNYTHKLLPFKGDKSSVSLDISDT